MARLTVEIPDHLSHYLDSRCKKFCITKTAFLADLIEAFHVEESEWMAEGSQWDRKKAAADAILRKFSDKKIAVEKMKEHYTSANSQLPLSFFRGKQKAEW